jgi:subtilisin family serine protease
VAAAFQGSDEVRVIVKLKDQESGPQGPYSTQTVSGESEKKSIKQQIKKNQDSVLGQLDIADAGSDGQLSVSSDFDFKLKHRYSTTNAFAGSVTRKGLKKLLDHPGVEKVTIDRPVKASLDVSVPLINADDVWALSVNNLSVNGSGQTICIIDTGINYSHPDFNNLSGFPNAKVIGGYDFVNSDADPRDDHSHGSHCAGIAASEDSTYTGVAPGARLVAIKALDSNGDGWSSDIIAGIDWCTDNATAFNISVISMSLGSALYDNNGFGCDDYDPSTAQAISNAVASDILVAVAAGNYYDSGEEGVAEPGCISDATSVGITNDADSMVSWGQRSSTLDLVAPGLGIIATSYDGTHESKQGTSMSTPHVAGAAALVQQYFREKHNRTLSPAEIEWIMKFNSKDIYDSTTDFTYRRVDAYKAVTSKGAVSTTVGATPFYTTTPNPHDSSCLAMMANGTSCNVSWIVNATGDMQNYTFFVIFQTAHMDNITQKLNITITNNPPALTSPSINNLTGNTTTVFNFTVNYSDADNHAPYYIYAMIGSTNITNYSMLPADASDTDYTDGKLYYYQTTLAEGNYSYYFNASDLFNSTSTAVVYAPNVTDNLPPSLNLSSPIDHANVSAALQEFHFNVSDEASSPVNCSLTFDGSIVNYTVVTNSTLGVISYSIPADGTYLWNITCSDASNSNTSGTRTITYDSTAPVITLISPENDSVLPSNMSDFVFRAEDGLFSSMSCTLIIGSIVAAANTSVANNTNTTFSGISLAAGSVSWLVNCTDPVSNTANSTTRALVAAQSNMTTFVNATAGQTVDINATANVDINLSTSQNTTGTVNVSEYNTNPANTSASTANGFAALGIGTFISIEASPEIQGNLSWYLLNIYYSDAALPSNIDESTLRIYYFNATSGQWEQEPDSGVDTDANRVWANITHFSIFSAGGSAESRPSGGGGGGGSVTASSEPIVVIPTFSASLVEAPRRQEISVIFENSSYLFKVKEMTSSLLTIDTLPDSSSYLIANGLSRSFDLDGDGRDDIQVSYSGKYNSRAMVIFYLISKPAPIPLLPPRPRAPREEPEIVENITEGSAMEQQAAPVPMTQERFSEMEMTLPSVSQGSFLDRNKLLIYIFGAAVIVIAALLAMYLLESRFHRVSRKEKAPEENSGKGPEDSEIKQDKTPVSEDKMAVHASHHIKRSAKKH